MEGKKIWGLFAVLFLLTFTVVVAHPGNTDGSGGHTCRTNCEQWGLQHGEYHYHNGGPAEPAYDPQAEYDAGYKKGYDTAYQYASKCEDYDWWWEGTDDYGAGFEDGIDAGHADGDKVCQANIAQQEEEKRQAELRQQEEVKQNEVQSVVVKKKEPEATETITEPSADEEEESNYDIPVPAVVIVSLGLAGTIYSVMRLKRK